MIPAPALHFHIGLNARRANSGGWGDLPYARALTLAIRARGHEATIFFRDEKPETGGGGRDVILRIIGPHLGEALPGFANLLWIISPPNLLPVPALARFQSIFVASSRLATAFRAAGLTAEYMPQATDFGQFHPGAAGSAAEPLEISFVGNLADRAARQNVHWALDAGAPIRVWGAGWADQLPKAAFGGARVDPADLAAIYARSRIVLNSHMGLMASLGMMSNRSFDAMACGAVVLSDRVQGFSDPDLPDLIQTGDRSEFLAALDRALAAPRRSLDERRHAADALRPRYDFGGRAERFILAAQDLLRRGETARPAFLPRQIGSTVTNGRAAAPGRPDLHLSDAPAAKCPLGDDPGAALDALLQDGPLAVILHLSDPTGTAPDETATAPMLRAALALRRIAAVLERRSLLHRLTVLRPRAEARRGILHPMMADHIEAQAIALDPARDPEGQAMLRLATRARRLLDVMQNDGAAFGSGGIPDDHPEYLVRAMNDRPLYAHMPDGFSREKDKRHLQLWPRAEAPALDRPIGIFLHLFYTDMAPLFAERLHRIGVARRIHISTDSAEKAATLAGYFPDAEIRVLPNRGRDVCPKLFGFRDRHGDHDIILHLHGKKSGHSVLLDGWLGHMLDCLLPAPPEVNRILSLFQSVPSLGIVAPLTYRTLLGAAHWGDNRELAQEVLRRMGPGAPMPADADLQFPVGSMFWARRSSLQPLLDLALEPGHFPPEGGQVDATLAHAFERLFGVVCRAQGQHLIRVAPQGLKVHRAHRLQCKRNGDLRAALDAGFFDP